MKIRSDCCCEKRLTTLLAVIVLGLLTQVEAPAQQIVVQGRAIANREQSLYERFSRQLDEERQAAQKRIQLQLEDVDNACQLTDSQRKKLSIASKGAVKSYMTRAVKQVKESAQREGFDFEPGNPPKEVEDDAKAGNVAQAQNVFFLNALGGATKNTTIEQEKIWKNSLQKILSPEQAKKLGSWTMRRKKLTEKAAVDKFVARVDEALLLSPNQREKLTSWVGKNHGTKLAERIGKPQFPRPIVVNNNAQGKQPTQEKATVAGILSNSQLKAWSTSFQNELDGLAGQPMAIPAIRMIPAAPAVIDIKIDDQ